MRLERNEIASPRVAVVDSDDAAMASTRALLGQLGCTSVGFSSAEAAVATLVRFSGLSDVVLCAAGAPGMSGWQLLDALHANARPRPAILLGSDRPFEVPPGHLGVPEAMLASPYEPVELACALRTALHRPALSVDTARARLQYEHECLWECSRRAVEAFQEGEPRRLERSMCALAVDLQRHFALEERTLLLQLSYASPESATELVNEHRELREQLVRLRRCIWNSQLPRALRELMAFESRLNAHEGRERFLEREASPDGTAE